MVLYFLLIFFAQCFSIQAIQVINRDVALDSSAYFALTEYSQLNSWPDLSRNRAIALRTERDVSANVTIGNNVFPGVDLNKVLFNNFGYTSDSLDYFGTLMEVGIQTFVLNLYYNENSATWGLCPKSKLIQQSLNYSSIECNVSTFNISSLINTMNSFILSTNNNLNVNVMFLLLKLNSISISSNITVANNLPVSNITNLSEVFTKISKIVSPFDIDSSDLPTLNNLLFKLGLRVFPIIIEDNLLSNSTYNYSQDMNTFFYTSNINRTAEYNSMLMDYDNIDDISCLQKSSEPNGSYLHFSYDTYDSPYSADTYTESIKCGYSPIISHSLTNLSDISMLLELSSWAWSPFQPTFSDFDELNLAALVSNDSWILMNANSSCTPVSSIDAATMGSSTSVETSDSETCPTGYDYSGGGDNDEYLNRCAVITKIGWVATSCDRKWYSICQNSLNASDLVVTDNKRNYMNAGISCKDIGKKYDLAVPRNTYDQQYFISLIPKGEPALWIDLNSLASKNCWVVGLNSNCPYQLVISNHIFARMISPSTIMAFLLFLLLFVLQFQRLPVHKNRKHWRKLLNENLKNDYDGVPS